MACARIKLDHTMEANMRVIKKQAIIMYSLLNSNEPISGLVLAKQSGLSLKTVKKEIDTLNDYLATVGFQIVSRFGEGYECEILDENKFKHFASSFKTFYHNHHYFENNQRERIHFIIRRLLTNTGNLFISDLADDCCCSPSIINRDMIEAKAILATFRLEVKNKTNNGLIVIGNEWDLRLALIYEHKIYKRFPSEIEYDEYDFSRFFLSGLGIYKKLKALVLEKLEQNHLHMAALVMGKVAYTIILSMTRKAYSDNLILPEFTYTHAALLPSYKAAKEIWESLAISDDVSYCETDVLGLAGVISAYQTYLPSDLNFLDYPEDFYRLADEFLSYLGSYYNINYFDMISFREDLACCFASLFFKSMYHIFIDHDIVINLYSDGLSTLDYCMILYKFINEKTNINATIYDVSSFYYIFNEFVSAMNKQIKRRVLVTLREGYYKAKNLCSNLRTIKTPYNIEFTPCEFSDLFRHNPNDFDFLATNIEDKDLSEEWKIKTLPVFYFRKNIDFVRFINQVNKPVYFRVYEMISINDIYYPKDIKSDKDLYRYIARNVLSNHEHIEAFLHEVDERNAILSPERKNQLVVLRSFKDILHETFLKLIICDKPFRFKDEMIQTVIIYNSHDNNVEHLQFMSRFIARLMHSDELLFTYNQTEDYEIIRRVMDDRE